MGRALITFNNYFVEWFRLWTHNLSKYRAMLFICKHSPIIHSYYLLGLNILCVDNSMINLGFKFNQSLEPRLDIGIICCKILKIV